MTLVMISGIVGGLFGLWVPAFGMLGIGIGHDILWIYEKICLFVKQLIKTKSSSSTCSDCKNGSIRYVPTFFISELPPSIKQTAPEGSRRKIPSPWADRNDYSMVLWLQYKEVDFLFTGDIGIEQEQKITSFSQSGWNISSSACSDTYFLTPKNLSTLILSHR